MPQFGHGASAKEAKRLALYYPQKRPGFVAWATGFDYGDGRLGLSFKETLRTPNLAYVPPRLEMGEAVGAPVSYCSVECGSETEESYRVYMVSEDDGETFTETGRCQLEQGSFCNAGFPSGRILGFDVPRINEDGTGWCDYILVRESYDGGATWAPLVKLLEGTAPYLWRTRRLRDGTILLLASLYGTPWGEGRPRATRNTMLPGESYLNKIQTFFMTTRDGHSFTGPHYVLPGVGAHEYDVAEEEDGSLLFIAGDVQATPVARQRVQRQGDSYLNGTLYGIRRGAPPDPKTNPQGGFVPETLVMLPGGLLVGARRNRPYSCSNDGGENWYEIDGLPVSPYQPYLMLTPGGRILNLGHFGGDLAFGQEDMYIEADLFRLENHLPAACTLGLSRCLAPDGHKYENRFSATLCSGGQPVAGEMLTFRFMPVWNPDGTVNTTPQAEAPIVKTALTGADGTASVAADEFDGIPDIHYYYNVSVAYEPPEGGAYRACEGPMMCTAALSPHRKRRYPYEAYLAEGSLFLAPGLLQRHPGCLELLGGLCGQRQLPQNALPTALAEELLRAGALEKIEGGYRWYSSIHSENGLDKVLPMAEGDWYV